jgi:hypothetical protein
MTTISTLPSLGQRGRADVEQLADDAADLRFSTIADRIS